MDWERPTYQKVSEDGDDAEEDEQQEEERVLELRSFFVHRRVADQAAGRVRLGRIAHD